MIGGKVQFTVKSISFEISVEVGKGKVAGSILERSQGASCWIRFGESVDYFNPTKAHDSNACQHI